METFFDSRLDLLQRKLQKHSDRLKKRTEETFKLRDISSDQLAENFDREVKNFKLKVRNIDQREGRQPPDRLHVFPQVQTRMTRLSASWQSAKVVRTREKVSFFLGVMTLLLSALLFGLAPQCVFRLSTIMIYSFDFA